jgi:hypothetical protein
MRALFNWLTLSGVGIFGSIFGVDGIFLFNEERGSGEAAGAFGAAGAGLGATIGGGSTVGFAIDIGGFGSTIVIGFIIGAAWKAALNG